MTKSNVKITLANFERSAEELENMALVAAAGKEDLTLEEGREMTDRITEAQLKSDRATRAILGMVAVGILRAKNKESIK